MATCLFSDIKTNPLRMWCEVRTSKRIEFVHSHPSKWKVTMKGTIYNI